MKELIEKVNQKAPVAIMSGLAIIAALAPVKAEARGCNNAGLYALAGTALGIGVGAAIASSRDAYYEPDYYGPYYRTPVYAAPVSISLDYHRCSGHRHHSRPHRVCRPRPPRPPRHEHVRH